MTLAVRVYLRERWSTLTPEMHRKVKGRLFEDSDNQLLNCPLHLVPAAAAMGRNTQCTESVIFHDGITSLTGVRNTSCNNPP